MKLGPFFETITPFIEGRIDHARVTAALWPGDATGRGAGGGVDGERLAIYGRFCRTHRFEVLALFAETRAAVLARGGEAAWERLVEDFFLAHPMRHFELFENGAAFPEWLGAEAEGRGLPSWLAEAADAEWWLWRAEYGSDPDVADEAEGAGGSPTADAGPLRIAHHVELRPYAHDIAGWLGADEGDRAAAPAPGDQLVLFWRDHDLDGRFAAARPVELALLKAVSEGMTLTSLAAATGLSMGALSDVARELADAGILDGAAPVDAPGR